MPRETRVSRIRFDFRARDPRPFRLHRPVTYQDAIARFTIPAGFASDLASIPAIGRLVTRTWGRHTPAALVHDYLYETGIVDRRRPGVCRDGGQGGAGRGS